MCPLSFDIGNYLESAAGYHFSDDAQGFAALMTLISWLVVGYLVYEGRPAND
jgi:hypothetical protein